MSRNHILYPLSAALAATLALSACKKPEPAAPPPAPEATAPAPAPIAAPVAAASLLNQAGLVGAALFAADAEASACP